MKLNLQRPIVFFDLETTGTDIARDRIVEICLLKVLPDGSEDNKVMRINPGCHIPEAASAVHGIYDADVRDCPHFADVAAQIWDFIRDCDLGGFNSNRFDVPLLVEELLRAGIDADMRRIRRIDVQNIYHKLERRTLTAAYKFYCDKDLENAHSAGADTHATYEVLCAQLDHYPTELRNDVDFLTEFSTMDRCVDLAGRIVLNDNGVEVFNFGKYKGQPVADVLRRDPSYYAWMQQGDFTLNTKQVLTQIALRNKK